MLRFFDGGDYNDPSAARWNITLPGRTTNPVRTGSHALFTSSGVMQRDIGADLVTVIVGAAVYKGGLNQTFLVLRDGGSDQITIRISSSGALEARRGDANGTLLGSSAAGIFLINQWIYIEAKVTIDNTVGVVELRVNGGTSPVLNLTGQDTQNTSNAFTNRYFYQDSFIDDHYLCDTTGAVNNNFLGDVKIETLYVNGAGNSTQFTPSTGSNFQNVDETQTSNGDTDYNFSNTVGHKDTFTMTNLLTTSGNIFGVQSHINTRKDDVGTREITTLIRNGTTETPGATFPLSTSYLQHDSAIYETNPDTSVAWTVSDVNNMEAGYTIIT